MAYDKATDRRSVKGERVNPMNDEHELSIVNYQLSNYD